MTYKIYIDHASEGFHVNEEGYQALLQFAVEYAVCRICKRSFSKERPNIAGLLCLKCFLQTQKQRNSLTHIGQRTSPYGTYHQFINPITGYIHETRAGIGEKEEADQNTYETLKYWKFAVPTYIDHNGVQVPIEIDNCTKWSIYGDKPKKEVVVFRVWDIRPGYLEAHFVTNKQTVIQLNRRQKRHREALAIAKKRNHNHEYAALSEILNESTGLELRQSLGLDEPPTQLIIPLRST